ncbi:Protein kinase C iota type [Heterocephalus glaber]|uniref:Protein kinase C iota type n=1 Tax=Heterocephalus glaber TaxID=10181 RepID=G5BX28_HETGA|nr:Protein kinase C iota type [Heterocephalus glaber]
MAQAPAVQQPQWWRQGLAKGPEGSDLARIAVKKVQLHSAPQAKKLEKLGVGFADVQEHPFFQNVDWDMMEQKQVVPPFKPNISEGFGLNFDPEFTKEPVWLTPDDNDIMRELDGYEFAGFEYINHLTMYEEWVRSSFFNYTFCLLPFNAWKNLLPA